jgi:hypothetical protein
MPMPVRRDGRRQWVAKILWMVKHSVSKVVATIPTQHGHGKKPQWPPDAIQSRVTLNFPPSTRGIDGVFP